MFSPEEIVFSCFYGIAPTDRSGLMNDCLRNISHDYPIPDKGDIVTLEDCITDRCNTLSQCKNLVLMWSGGIDSTLVFYALVSHNIPFYCVGDIDSKVEYPKLYLQIINNEFNNVTWIDRKDINESWYVDKVITSGEIGDQLVGSDVFLKHFELLEDRKMPAHYKFDDPRWNRFYDTSTKILEKNDLTVGEFSWAMNFIFKFAYTARRLIPIVKHPDKTNIKPFFESEMFQRWALHNFSDNVHFDKLTDYKMPYKKYIFKQNNDIDYLNTKIKYGSLVLYKKNQELKPLNL